MPKIFFSQTKALSHLAKDPIMSKIIKEYPPPVWEKPQDLFSAIIGNIIGQQLSGKPAKIITKRFTGLFNAKTYPDTEDILTTPDQKIRDCGLSWAKVRYVKSLCEAIATGQLDPGKIKKLPDEEVINELIKVKGIGQWTAEMILIFHLRRPDVFSLGDLGLRTAVSKLYKIDRNNLKKITQISQRWKPYRSLASRYLWKSLDNE